jgi:TonB family protein
MPSKSRAKKWTQWWTGGVGLFSLIAALGQMPAQAQGSQPERDTLVREVDALSAAGNHAAALQAAHKLVASTDALGTSESFRAPALVKLSFAYRALQRYGEAENALRLAVAVLERGNSTPDKAKAALWGGLGDLNFRQNRLAESVDLYLRAISMAKDPVTTREQEQLARLQLELALVYQQRGMDSTAEPLLRTSLASHELLYKSDALQLATVSRALGNSLRRKGDLDAARPLLERALAIAGPRTGTELFLAGATSDLGLIDLERRDLPKAIAAFTQSLEILEKMPSNQPRTKAGVLFGLSRALEESGRYADALGPARRALELQDGVADLDESKLQIYIDQSAKVERKLGNVQAARLLETRSAAIKARIELLRSDPLETMATVVEQVKPAYPAMARRMGWQGRVVMRALIGADGGVLQVTVLESSGDKLLDDAAMASVQASRYSPARSRGGRAMASALRVPISFVLDSNTPRSDGAQQPYGLRVIQAVRSNVVLAEPVSIATPAEITLKIAPDGKILEHTLSKSSGNPTWDAAVLAGVARTATLPLDVNGLAPSVMVFSMKPNE